MTSKWQDTKKYANLYYILTDIFECIEKKVDEDGWTIDEHKPTEEAVKEMVEALEDHGIDDKEEMLSFIMHVSKGQANPKVVDNMLSSLLKR
jgi:predicted amidohydrolase YtcJ